MPAWIDADNPVLGQIDDAAAHYGVPRELAHVVAQMESGYNPRADSGKAQGVMQLTPATGRALGVSNRFDSSQSVDAGVRLIGSLLRKYGGDTRLALAAYNAGETAVNRAGRNVPNFPETQAYVTRGLSLLNQPSQPRAEVAVAGAKEAPWIDASTVAPKPTTPAFKEPEGSAMERLGAGAWKTIVGLAGLPKAIAAIGPGVLTPTALLDPTSPGGRVLAGIAQTSIDQAEQAKQAAQQGRYSEAFGHGLATAPLVGPPIAEAIETHGPTPPVFDKYGNIVQPGRTADIAGLVGDVGSQIALMLAGEAPGLAGRTLPALRAVGEQAGAAGEALGKAGTVARAATEGVVKAVPEAINEGLAKSFYGILGGPGGMFGAGKAAAIRTLAKGAYESVKEALATPEAAAPAAEVSLGEALAKSQGIDWAALKPEEQAMLEHSARAQANAVAAAAAPRPTPPVGPVETPPPAPAAPAAPAKTIQEMVQEEAAARKAAAAAAEAPAPAAAPAPEAAPSPTVEAPAAAPAEAPATPQQAAREVIEPLTRIDRLTNYFRRGRGKGVTTGMLDSFGENEWRTIARDAGTEAPTPEQIAQVRSNIAEYEAAATRPAKAGKLTPSEAKADFEQRKATRTLQPQAGEAAFQEQRARIQTPEPPPETPPAAPAPPPAAPEVLTPADVTATPEGFEPAEGGIRLTEEPGRYTHGEEGARKTTLTRAEEVKLFNMQKKAQRFASALREHGIASADLADLNWGDVTQQMIDKGLLKKGEKPPTSTTTLIGSYLQKAESEAAPAAAAPQRLAGVTPYWTSEQGPGVLGPRILPTVAEARVEALAKHFAQSDITAADIAKIADKPEAFAQLQRLSRSLGIEGAPMASEIKQIVERVRQLRQKQPPAPAAAAAKTAKGAAQ
jgi:hypothetical protein